ncbi:ATP-binding protein [Sulfurimonas sp.]|uniref:ATP-binding protein n=1 Tax=Sulfurimonas sp. TaxID=2022749 RepID=UPI0039E64F2E
MNADLRTIVDGLDTTSGQDFFNKIVLNLSLVIEADYVFIARLDLASRISKTIALCAKNKIIENFEYGLKDSPCSNLSDGSICCYPSRVADLFPKDQLLIDMKIQGYMGIPLHDLNGNVLGLLVALSKKSIDDEDKIITLFKVFSGRIAVEIERSEQDRALRDSERRLKLAITGANDGLWDWDLQTNDVYYSPRWLEMLGYKPHEFPNTLSTWEQLVNPEDKERVLAVISDYVNGKINNMEVEFTMKHKEGHFISILARAKFATDDEGNVLEPLRLVGTHVDITQQKVLAQQLEELNKNLEKQIQERTKELVLAKELAEYSTKSKSDFLANMSHEIRTPLNAIMGFINLLKEKEEDKEKLEYLSTISSSSESLTNIINDILDFSKIESGRLHIEYVDFDPMHEFISTKALFMAKCTLKNIQFHSTFTNAPEYLYGDPLRIKQVVNNLLSNAIKFTPENNNIHLDINYESDTLYVSLKDKGIGISREYQENIFDSFTQADTSTTRKYGGSGLGLSISHNLIKLMGGELKVKSELGLGSEFYFSIPIKKGNKSITNNAVIENLDFTSLKILLVEDNQANQLFMKVLFKKIGLLYDIANDGIEAIEHFKNTTYNLILMDENMPNMNGITATKEIRKIEKEKNLKRMPIIALTANAIKGDREKFLAADMDEYLSKPLNKNILIRMLNKFYSNT